MTSEHAMLLFVNETLADHVDAECISRDPTNNNASLEPCDASDPKQVFTYDTHPISGITGQPLEGLSGIRFWQDGNCLTEVAPGFSSTHCDSRDSFFRVGLPTEDAFVGKNPITGDQVDFKNMYNELGECYFLHPAHQTKRFDRSASCDFKWHVHYLNEPAPTNDNTEPTSSTNDNTEPANKEKDYYFIAIPVFIIILLVFLSRS